MCWHSRDGLGVRQLGQAAIAYPLHSNCQGKRGAQGQAQGPGAGRWGQGAGEPGVRHSGQAASASMWSKMALTVPRALPLPTQVKAQSAQNLCPHSRPSGWYITSCRGCNLVSYQLQKAQAASPYWRGHLSHDPSHHHWHLRQGQGILISD